MFWSGNYIVVRELNFLLKEENVSLAQVLEADDILQECKADNKALIQFLTRPEILSELVSLITEEPRPDVELTQQYRHASAACEVLTSQLSALAERLSLDAALMHRLCDFMARPPPLNPLLASYFSKTVEMLLDRSPKQDWYLYHIVCLRVLDFFKSRRDFLPNILRHLATSAIADTFKCFVRLDDLFNKILMEWLEEHQFLENLIAVVCCSYSAEESPATPPHTPPPANGPSQPPPPSELTGNGDNHNDSAAAAADNRQELDTMNNNSEGGEQAPPPPAPAPPEGGAARVAPPPAARLAAVASANAAALLTDLITNGCATDGGSARGRTAWALVARLQSEPMVQLLLQSMFTSPPALRHAAIANGATVLTHLLNHEPILGGGAEGSAVVDSLSGVERALAPHLPLLHQALLTPPRPPGALEPGDTGRRVGWSRVRIAALLARLALVTQGDVPKTLLTLGTPGVVMELVFQYPDNNFLHAEGYSLLKNALCNQPCRTQYARHLLLECDLLTRLMDLYEENENNKALSRPRSAIMGHAVLMLRRLARVLGEEGLLDQLQLPEDVTTRWAVFQEDKLKPLAQQHDTPLGGYYPSENIYEVDIMPELGVETSYEFNDVSGTGLDDLPDDDMYCDDNNQMLSGQNHDQNEDFSDVGGEKMARAQNCFLEMAQQRFGDDMWEEGPSADDDEEGEGCEGRGGADVHDVLSSVPPWETNQCTSESGGGEGWAQFNADFGSDPFANSAAFSASSGVYSTPSGVCSTPSAPASSPTDPFAPSAVPFSHPTSSSAEDEFTPFASAVPPPPAPAAGCSAGGSDCGVRAAAADDNALSSDHFDNWRGTFDATDEVLQSVEASLSALALQPMDQQQDTLASNLLTAMSGMTAADLANIVNANGGESEQDDAIHPTETTDS